VGAAAAQQEPEAANEGLLNQGGLLSLSSISPQTSGNPAPEAAECTLGSCESARSTDSGMLPQRPTRRHVVKPSHVPALDFTRLQQHLEEEEEEEYQGEGGEEVCAGEEERYAEGPGDMHAEHEMHVEGGYSPDALQERHFPMYDLVCDPRGQHPRHLQWEPGPEGHLN